MAVGKSTTGPLVAQRLGLPFVDLDALVAQNSERSVATLFELEGEEGFRAREAAAVAQLALGPPAVIALGGGTLHHGENLARLRCRLQIVVLHLPWAELEPRLANGGGRPLGGRARSLYQSRQQVYREAGPVLDISGLDPEQVAAAVVALVQQG